MIKHESTQQLDCTRGFVVLSALLCLLALLTFLSPQRAFAEDEGTLELASTTIDITEDTTWTEDIIAQISDTPTTYTIPAGVTLTIDHSQTFTSAGKRVIFKGEGTVKRGSNCSGVLFELNSSKEPSCSSNTLIFDSVTVDGSAGQAATGSLVSIEGTDNTLSLRGSAVLSNNWAHDGGAVRLWSSGGVPTLLMQDSSSIQGNKADNGGGVYAQGNTANTYIRMSGSSAIFDNTAQQGGGLYLEGKLCNQETLQMLNTSVIGSEDGAKGNQAKYGGGIFVGNGNGDISLSGLRIHGNSATTDDGEGYGGGVFFRRCGANRIIKVRPASIIDEEAGSPYYISNCNIQGNSADCGGGVSVSCIEEDNPTCMVVIEGNTLIANNTAYLDGGGVCAESRQGEAEDRTMCVVAETAGSWLYVKDATITQNTAGRDGGGIFSGAGKASAFPEWINTTGLGSRDAYLSLSWVASITDNTAARRGGGVCSVTEANDNGFRSHFDLYGAATITGNSAAEGGGIYTNENLNLYEQPTVKENTLAAQEGGSPVSSNVLFVPDSRTQEKTHFVSPCDSEGDVVDIASTASIGFAIQNAAKDDIVLSREDGSDCSEDTIAAFVADESANSVVLEGAEASPRNLVLFTDGPSSKKILRSFSINGVDAAIDQTAKTVALTLPAETDRSALVATFSVSSGATAKVAGQLQQSGVTAQDYTNPVTMTIHAEDASTASYLITVSLEPSSSKAITAFSINGLAANIDHSNRTISLELPFGTSLNALVPVFEVSPGARVSVGEQLQTSGVTAQSFTSPLDYIVKAQDGSTQSYQVSVSVAELAPGISFSAMIPFDPTDPTDPATTVACSFTTTGETTPEGLPVVRTKNGTEGQNPGYYSYAIDPTTAGSITIPSTVEYNGVTMAVAEIGTESFGSYYSGCDLLSGVSLPDSISSIGDYAFAHCTALSSLEIPDSVETVGRYILRFCSGLTTLTWQGDANGEDLFPDTRSFANIDNLSTVVFGGKRWTIPDTEYELSRIPDYYYTVRFYDTDPSVAASPELLGTAVLHEGLQLGSIIEGLSTGVYSGAVPALPAQTEAWTYEGGAGPSTQLADSCYAFASTLSSSCDIVSYSIGGVSGVVDTTKATVKLTLPANTDLSALVADFVLSDSASAFIGQDFQQSAVSENDFSQAVVYTVVAQDGTSKTWTVSANNKLSSDCDILSFSLAGNKAAVDPVTNSITVSLPADSSRQNLAASFTLSPGASAKIGDVVQVSDSTKNDFTRPLVYTVVAEDGASQEWTVQVVSPATDINAVSIEPIPQQRYTGQKLTPSPVISFGKRVLVEGVDYEVSYANNINIGRASITIQGKGSFYGTRTVSFDIAQHGLRTATQLGGVDCYETAALIALEAFPQGSERVIVATGESYYDALSANGLAGLLECPVLLTPSQELSPYTKKAITDLGAKQVIVVGGPVSVSTATATNIRNIDTVSRVRRIYGLDRYETCLRVYEYGRNTVAGGWKADPIIASGEGFWDALAVSPYSYVSGSPILLIGSSLSGDMQEMLLKDWKGSQLIIVGGNATVSRDVETWIGTSLAKKPLRLHGNTCYDTAAAINEFCTTHAGMTYEGATFATANHFADALVSGALCGSKNSVLIPCDPGHNAVVEAAAKDKNLIDKVYFAGGPATLSYEYRDTILKSLGGGFEKIGW